MEDQSMSVDKHSAISPERMSSSARSRRRREWSEASVRSSWSITGPRLTSAKGSLRHMLTASRACWMKPSRSVAFPRRRASRPSSR